MNYFISEGLWLISFVYLVARARCLTLNLNLPNLVLLLTNAFLLVILPQRKHTECITKKIRIVEESFYFDRQELNIPTTGSDPAWFYDAKTVFNSFNLPSLIMITFLMYQPKSLMMIFLHLPHPETLNHNHPHTLPLYHIHPQPKLLLNLNLLKHKIRLPHNQPQIFHHLNLLLKFTPKIRKFSLIYLVLIYHIFLNQLNQPNPLL